MGLVNSVGYIHPFSSMGSKLMASSLAAYKYPRYLFNRKYLVLYLALTFSRLIGLQDGLETKSQGNEVILSTYLHPNLIRTTPLLIEFC